MAQHEAHQPAPQASAGMAPCAQVQPVVDSIIAAAMARLESARLSNSAAEMRAAVDHVESALRDIRTQLSPCTAAAAAPDPQAGHTMPGMRRPPGACAPAAPIGSFEDADGRHTDNQARSRHWCEAGHTDAADG